jgi:undecaprenyl-diphosphatase
MNNPAIFVANTYGVFFFIIFIVGFVVVREHNKELALHTLFSVLTTTFFVILLKELFLTNRPFIVDSTNPLAGLAWLSSFPSLHAAIAFAAATTVALHYRRLGIFLLIIASLIGIGRVAADVHYPIDIAFGILIGVTISMFFENVHFRHVRRRKVHH